MATRTERLKKLLAVQGQIKSLHENRHAGFVAQAIAARAEAAAIVERFNADDSLSALFPDVYHRRIAAAVASEEQSEARAIEERANIAAATAKAKTIERNYRDAARKDEREQSDRDRLDLISQRLGRPAK